jgi:hypothetical protein
MSSSPHISSRILQSNYVGVIGQIRDELGTEVQVCVSRHAVQNHGKWALVGYSRKVCPEGSVLRRKRKFSKLRIGIFYSRPHAPNQPQLVAQVVPQAELEVWINKAKLSFPVFPSR